MKNETIKKINNFGKAGYIICKIGKIILSVAAIACLAGALLMCFIPKDALKLELITSNSAVIHFDDSLDISDILEIDTSDSILEIGDNTYKLVLNENDEPEVIRTTFYISNVKWVLFAAVLACVAAYVAFYFAGKLCAYFKDCDTPFSSDISNGFIHLAWSLVPVCVVGSLMNSSVKSIITGVLDISISVDMTTLLLILCVFMFSFIFKYGAKLQTESDETL